MRFGPFEIDRVLGSGAMATVYSARHSHWGPVALKVAMEAKYGSQLEREHAVLHRFDHPGIPRPRGFFQVANQPTLCMSLLTGAPYSWGEQGRTARDSVALAISLLELLDHVHRRGVVHCDVKGQNILVGDEAQLFDFGIARNVGGPAADSTGQVAGTLAYMAPEVLEGREVSPATDHYSLGVLLYHSLTGRFPFPSERELHLAAKQDRVWLPPTTIRGDLPEAVDELLFRLFEPRPADRPGSGALRAHLRSLVPSMPDQPSSMKVPSQFPEPGTTRDMPTPDPTAS